MSDPDIRVLVWNEFIHEKTDAASKAIYPAGMHASISAALSQAGGIRASTATLEEPEHGLTQERLDHTDVLIWWGHMAHDKVDDAIVERVVQRVWSGMGLIVLHSGHFSKPFKRLMGTGCDLKWREDGRKERLWIVKPGHPIAQGLGEYIELPQTEMYGEHFDIPAPDELIFVSWFQGGEVFRSGCCFHRGQGKIFYFRPGHETYPIYHNPDIQKVLANAARWARPTRGANPTYGNTDALEKEKPAPEST
jgi:trehalose utilization protein